MQNFRKILSWNSVKFLFAIGLLLFIVKKVDFAYIPQLGERLSWGWLVFRWVLLVALILIKSFQYYVLIKGIRYCDILNIVVWQNTLSNFVSNSAGVASYMTMLKTEQNVKWSRSGASFVMVKFGDLSVLSLYLALSTAVLWRQIAELQVLSLLLIFGMIFGLGVFFLAITQKESFVAMFSRLLFKLKIDRFSLVQRGLNWLRSLAAEDERKIFSLLRKSIFVSFAYMSVTMMYMYTVVGMFHLPIGIWESVYIAALLQLVSFVPIQVLGGLGVADVTMIYLYGRFGIPQAEMSTISLGVRALFYIMNAALFLYLPLGALFQKIKAQKGQPDVR